MCRLLHISAGPWHVFEKGLCQPGCWEGGSLRKEGLGHPEVETTTNQSALSAAEIG